MMTISHGKQRSIGVVLQYTQMVLSFAIQLVYTPIMLRILGTNEYGIYSLAASTISYLSLLSLGIGASYIRWYSIFKKENDREEIKKLNGLYLLVFSIIGIIALGLGSWLTINIHWFYNDTYTVNEIQLARKLMVFLTINLAVSFPSSVFSSYITSQEKFIFQKIVNMGITIIGPALNIVLLWLGYGSVGMVVATTSLSIIVSVVNVLYCIKKLGMEITLRNPNWMLLKDIMSFSVFIVINQVIDQINWQTDKIILGKIIGGASVAIYTVGANLNMMFTGFSSAVSGVFVPKVNLIVSRNDANMNEELTTLFIKVGRIQWFVLMYVLSGFAIFGRFFITIWAGAEYSNSYTVALLLMTPAVIPLIQNLGVEIQRAKYLHKFRSIAYLCMAIVNIGISIVFASRWGEIGAALGTTISLLLANGLIMNIYYHKRCGINIHLFWNSILSTLKSLLLPLLLGVSITFFYTISSIVDFLVLIAIYSLTYAISVYRWGLNSQEKFVVERIKAKVIKKRG